MMMPPTPFTVSPAVPVVLGVIALQGLSRFRLSLRTLIVIVSGQAPATPGGNWVASAALADSSVMAAMHALVISFFIEHPSSK